MTDDHEPHAGMIGNAGEPFVLTGLNVDGVSVRTALAGEQVEILRRHGVTSETYAFHMIATNLANMLVQAAARAGHAINPKSAGTILAVIRPDGVCRLYVDSAAVSLNVRVKRSVEAGAPLFDRDILDVTAMAFPLVDFEADDQVLVIFREGWRYGLYFDLTREFDRGLMEKTLGRLSRTLRYHERYAALSDAAFLARLIETGWFPFLELGSDEFARLYAALHEQHDVDKVGATLLDAFDAERVGAMRERWMANAHFAKRRAVIAPGLDAFLAGSPVPAIKTLVTEIEGILQDAYISAHSQNAKTGGLIQFALEKGRARATDEDSLYFPAEFQQYLTENIYQAFDPLSATVAASRHGVGHGAAPAEVYTQTRALQIILTLDQLSHYL